MINQSRYISIFTICLFIIGTAVFASFALRFSYLVYKQFSSIHWTPVEAIIEQWNVAHVWPRGGNTNLYRYELQPTLQYYVAGKKYSSTKLCYGVHNILSDFRSRKGAEEYIPKLTAIGARVVAFYNPRNPSEAVLFGKECNPWYDIFMICMTVAFYVVLLFIMRPMTWKSLIKQK